MTHAAIGVFGGSGFYSLLDDVEEVALDTPFGPPSAPLTVGDVGGRRVAFLPRHGRNHEHMPSAIPARANAWAMRMLGVRTVIGPCAVGSLRPDVHPGDFVVLDQLVDRTRGRADTFYDRGHVHHVSFADPYCPVVSAHARDAAGRVGVTVHPTGTIVVVNGPRFSTRAESRWFRAQGWDVVGMTQYPEAYLARELGMHYTGIALVTDYDTGVEDEPDVEPVTQEQVFAVVARNVDRVRTLLFDLLPALPDEPGGCACASAAGPLDDYEAPGASPGG
jgi:5'-methylthioadenosine phosphorylase